MRDVEPSSRMLDGIRVLDFTMFLAGPYCTRLMADLGAEVIKVEPPNGDFYRNAPPVRAGRSAQFGHFNCGKKSLSVDLKKAAGVDVILRLAADCDVFIENFRPGVMGKLGLGYCALKKVRPDVVYCSVSGYGQQGPSAHLPAFAPVVHARSGNDLMALRYNPALEKPLANRTTTADILAAVHALAAINAALFHRERTGAGQHLDVALMDTMHMMLAYEYQEAQFPTDRLPPLYRPLQTNDGFLMIAPVSEANFQALVSAMDRGQLGEDPRFIGGARLHNWEALMDEAETWTRQHDGAVAEALLLAAGCPCSVYQTVGESAAEPQVEYRGSAVEVRDGSGTFRVPNAPFQSDQVEIRALPWVAELGEHSLEILRAAGMQATEIDALFEAKVVRGGR